MRAVIVAAGSMDDPQQDLAWLHPNDLIIAADGGAAHCHTLGIVPNVIIGDLDSLASAIEDHFRRQNITIITHPTSKDSTDLELAVEYALDHEADEIIVLGALGQRWDHSLGNILLLANPAFQSIPIRMISGLVEIGLARPGRPYHITGAIGDLVSLIPLEGDSVGITTLGLEYALDDGRLKFGATRGISNTLTQDKASITVHQGSLLCLHTRQD